MLLQKLCFSSVFWVKLVKFVPAFGEFIVPRVEVTQVTIQFVEDLSRVDFLTVTPGPRGAGDKAGLIFVLGFVLSVWITCVGYRYGGPQG